MKRVVDFLIRNKKYFIIGGISGLFVSICLVVFLYLPSKSGEMPILSVSASKTNSVIKLSSGFIIKTNANYSKEEVSKLVSLDPAIDYDVKKLSFRKYEIVPKGSLPANSIITVGAVRDNTIVYKWAFQTESKLAVVGTYPKNESTDLDTKTSIEMTFSYADTIMDPSQITISPEVSGTLTKKGTYTWVFLPDKELLNDTKYTVTVKKGIKTSTPGIVLNDDYTFNFTTIKKQATNDTGTNFWVNSIDIDKINTFTTSDKPLIYIDAYNVEKDSYDADVTLYSVKNADALIKAVQSTDTVDTTGMAKYKTYTLKYNKNDGFIQFPDLLDEGYYYASIKLDNETLDSFIQINNIVTFVSNTENDNLVWVHDYTTDKPIEDLKVTYDNTTKTTDKDGVVVLPNKISAKDYTTDFMKVGSDKKDPLVVALNNYNEIYPTAYVYSDKTVYKPTDTIHVWGFVPTYRFNKTPDGKFKIVVGDYSSDITLNSNGTFEASIPITDYKDQYASIVLKYNDEFLGYKYVDIYKYEKPLYTYSIKTDKAYYFQDDKINVDINVEHISGIKAANKNLVIKYKDYSTEEKYYATTDTNGNAKVTIPAHILNNYSDKEDCTIEVYSADAEEDSDYSESREIGVFSRDIATTSDVTKTGDTYSLTVNTYKVDLDKLNKLYPNFSYSAFYGEDFYGDKIDTNVKVDIIEHKYMRDYSQQKTYNPITKTYYYPFVYKSTDTTVNTINDATKDGELKLDNLNYSEVVTDDYSKEYCANITTYDSKNREVTSNSCFYGDYSMYGYTNYEYLFELDSDKQSYSLGDNVALSLKETNDFLKKNDNGQVLSYAYKYGIVDYKINSADENISYTYDDKMFPDAIIAGAYYYNGRVYKIMDNYLSYNTDEKKLNVDISTDSNTYKPSDEVTANIKLTDNNGNPVKGTVNVSVVDEAVFVLSEDSTNILQTLYQREYYPNYKYVSYRYYLNNGGGGGGATGGGITARMDFRDTPLFKTIETDSNGNATVKFKLPDTVTTWRITTHAVTDNHQFGVSIKKIQAQLPFFIQTTVPRNVKTTDDFVVSATSLGNTSSTVNYTATIKELNLTKTTTGKIGSYVDINFGNLPVGKYTVSISATCGSNKDAYQYNVEVKDSFQETNITTTQKIGKTTLTITPTRNPVELYVYDESLKFYMDIINELSTQYGDRADIRIGNLKAKELEAKYYNEKEPASIKLSDFQTDKGVKFLSKDSEDVLLSALAAEYSLNYFDETSLYNAFRNVVDTSTVESEVLKAYMGLAALKRPVLIELDGIRDSGKRQDVNDSLYLALSYAFLGDYNTAKDVYEKEIKDNKKLDNYSQTLEAILTSMIDVPTSKALIEKLNFDVPNNDYLTFALISYVQNTIPYLKTPNKLSVTTANKTTDYTIDKMGVLRILSDKENIGTTKFKSDSNTLILEERYTGNYKDIDKKNIIYKATASIDSTVNKSQTTYLTVTLKDLQPYSYGKVIISLPNGLRLDQSTNVIDKDVYLLSNKIDYIELAVTPETSTSLSFTVGLIATNTGKYTIEPIIYENGDNYGVSNDLKIEVK